MFIIWVNYQIYSFQCFLKNTSQLKVPFRQVKSVDFGAKQKLYACKLCDEKFHKQGNLKKHKKREHN